MESYNVYQSKGVGKRMVVDRQKVKTSSESRYRVAGRIEVRAVIMVRQVSPENRQGSKQG